MGFKPNSHDMRQGHTVAGYACQPGFSPDGRYVISGDGEGKLWFWDWKTCKPYRTIKAHEGVCIGAAWHPMETSKARSCCSDKPLDAGSVPTEGSYGNVAVPCSSSPSTDQQLVSSISRSATVCSQAEKALSAVLTPCAAMWGVLRGADGRFSCNMQVATCGWDGQIKYWD